MSRKSSTRAILVATSAVAAVLSVTQPAFGQEDADGSDGGQSDEIIVTAQKVAQNILDVPISITAVSGQDLISTGATDILSLQRSAPGIIISNSGNDPQIIIRGAGVAGTNDIAVPVFMDGSYRPRNSQALASYLDLERVEFLRGPQGTLFGRNTLGGLMNIIPKAPSFDELDFGAAGTLGNYSARRIEGFVNVPIADILAIRLTASDEKRDPFVKNVFDKKGGLKDADATYMRAQLRFQPIDEIDVRVGYSYWKDTANGNADYGYKTLGIPVNLTTRQTNGVFGVIDPRIGTRTGWAGGRTQAGNVTNGDASAFVIDDPYKVRQDFRPVRNIKENSYFVDARANFLDHAFKIRFDHFKYSELRLTDTDQSSNSALVAGQLTKSKANQFDFTINSTHDLPIQYTIGYYTYDDANPRDTSSAFLWGYTSAAAPQDPTWAYWLYQNNGGAKTKALYGQAEYALTDKLKIRGGLRHSTEERQFFSASVNQSTLNDPLPSYGAAGVTTRGKDKTLDWRVGAEWKQSDELMLYGYAATAFISGGIQQGNTGKLLDPNEAFTWEIGAKGKLSGGNLRYAFSYYDSHYKGLTTTVFVQQGQTILAQSIPGGDTRARGVEMEASFYPTDQLTIDASIAMAVSKFGKFSAGNQFTEGGDTIVNGRSFFIMDGKRTSFSPPVTGSVAASYEIPLGNMGTLKPWARLYYSGAYRVTNQPYAFSRQDQYFTLDATLEWRSENGKISALLFANNITDEAYFTDGTVYSAARAVVDYSNPRTFGIRVGYNF